MSNIDSKRLISETVSSDTSYTTSSSSTESLTDSSDTETESEEDRLLDLIQRLKAIGKDALPYLMQIPKKLQMQYPIKKDRMLVEVGRSVLVPASFEKVVSTHDMHITEDGWATYTLNRTSHIFSAFASAMFQTTERIIASQVKLVFLKQIDKDYKLAKKSKNLEAIQKSISLVNKAIHMKDESWTDEEWITASKAFYAPIHVLHSCPRIPFNPHVRRYAFSPVLEKEIPLRFILEGDDYIIK